MAEFATLALKITSSGAARAESDLKRIEQGAKRTESEIDRLYGMFKKMTALFGASPLTGYVGQLIAMSDKMKSLGAQVKFVTNSTAEYHAVQSQLFAIAQRTRADLEATTTLYTRSARALKDYGYSQQRILNFTETLNKAMAVGGVGAQEQASALFQLSQSLGSGRLQGDEFKTIAESAPIILDVVAQYMGKTRSEVKALASDGKITSQVLFEAITGASAKISADFEKMPLTFGQAMTQMKNAVLAWVSDMDSAYGITGGLAQLVSFLAEHFKALANALKYAAIAYFAYSAAAAAQSFTNAAQGVGLLAGAFGKLATMIRTATAAMATNPLGALAVAIVGVSYALDQWIAKMEIGFGSFNATWGDVATGVWLDFQDVSKSVWDDVSSHINGKIADISQFFGGNLEDMGDLLSTYINGLIGSWNYAYEMVILTWNHFPAAMESLGVSAVNGLVSLVESAVNKILELVKTLLGKLNAFADTFGVEKLFDLSSMEVHLPKIQGSAAAKQFSQDAKKIKEEAFGKDYLEDAKNYLMLAGMRGKIANSQSAVDLSKSGKNTVKPTVEAAKGKGKGDLERARDSWLNFYDSLRQKAGSSLAAIGLEQERMLQRLEEYSKKGVVSFQEYETAKTAIAEKFARQRLELAGKYAPEKLLKANLGDDLKAIQELHFAGQLNQPEALKAEQNVKLNYAQQISQNAVDPLDKLRAQFDPLQEIRNRQTQELAQLQAFNDLKLITESEFQQRKKQLIEKYRNDEFQQEMGLYSTALNDLGSAFGNLTSIVEQSAGKQSSAYKAMFAVSKAFAIAEASIKLSQAISQAMADPTALTPAQKFANMAAVAAAGVNLVSQISSVGFAQGGFTGEGGKYTPAGIVHKGEYVFTKEAVSRLGVNYLDQLNYQRKAKPQGYANGGSVGGYAPSTPLVSNHRGVKVNIINNGEPTSANVETKETGDGLEITVELMQKIARQEAGAMIQQNMRPGGMFA